MNFNSFKILIHKFLIDLVLFLYLDKFQQKNDLEKVRKRNCGKSLLSKRFTSYIENLDETRDKVMEIMTNYNDEILVAQKKKKRRYEKQDDGWTVVTRK